MTQSTENQERLFLAHAMEKYASHLRSNSTDAGDLELISDDDTHQACFVFGLSINEDFDVFATGDGSVPEFFGDALQAITKAVFDNCKHMRLHKEVLERLNDCTCEA